MILEVLLALFGGFAALSVSALGFSQGIRFAIVQAISFVLSLVGLVLLAPLSLFHLWTSANVKSIKTQPAGLLIDKWLLPVNYVYGNPEDGVSGQQALVWSNGQQVPYQASTATGIKKWFVDAWRAYSWSVLRNSSDNLKYVFANPNGKMASVSFKLFGKQVTLALGWKPENGVVVPVISFN